jgi:acetolactate synthase-1/2/3 large subunit
MVRQWQEMFYQENYSQVDLQVQPDFVKLAEAYGLKGFRVDRPEDMAQAVERAVATPGPVLVDVRVARNENCFPMVPSGASLRDIIEFGDPPPPIYLGVDA